MAHYDGSIRINTEIDSKKASIQLSSLENRIVKTADKIASLRSKMDSLKNVKVPTKEYAELTSELNKQIEKLNELNSDKQRQSEKGLLSENQLKSVNNRISETEQKIKNIANAMNRLDSAGKAFTFGNPEEIAKTAQQLKYAENEMSVLNQKRDLLKLKNEDLQQSYVKLGDSIRNAFELARKGIVQVPIAAMKKGIEGLKMAFSGLGSIAKKSLSFIGSGLKKMGSSMLGFGKSTKSSNNILQSSFSNILKYGLGIRSLYALVNKIRSGIKEGFSNLANENENFKNSINGLKASLATLGNSIAAAFAPIVQVAIPYIQQLIGWITKVMSLVGQFMGAITGQKTYTKAVKQSAGAMEDAAGAAGDAKKAMEGYLSPLDEINKMNKKDDSSGGGGGGGGAGGMFEEVPIDSGISNIVQKIKDLIKAEDWEGLGAYLAEWINKGMQKVYDAINWDNVGPRITYFVNAFTRTFNSLVDHIDWDLMGRTIGAGINTVVNTLNLLIEGIDWKNLGKKFSEGVMGLVDEVNWENVGRFFGNKFMILWNTLYGVVTNLDYKKLGIALGDALNGAVKAINLGTVGTTLGKGITGIFESAIAFSKTFDWKGLGRNISDGINKFFQNFDGKTAAQGLNGLINGIFDTLIEIIDTTDWSEIGKDIVDFIVNIDWGGFTGKFIVAAGKLILGLFVGLVEAIATTNWIEVWLSILDSFKKAFGIHSPSTVMAEQGGYIISGLLKGLKDKITDVLKWFAELPGKIKDKLGDAKKWLEEKGKGAIEGIKKGWDSAKESSFAQSVSNMGAFVKQKAGDATQWIQQKGKDAITGLKNGWESVKEGFLSTVAKIGSQAKTKIGDIGATVKSKGQDIVTGLKNGFNSNINSFLTTVSGLKDKVRSGLSGLAEIGKSAATSLANGIKSIHIPMPHFSFTTKSFKVGKTSFSLPSVSVNWYKKGGLFNAPSVIGVGEAGSEAVLPLKNRKVMGMLADSIVARMGRAGYIPNVPIPRLAQGTVVPQNKEFISILGDNKREPEIVSPISTIEQAVKNAVGQMGGMGKEITIKVPVYLDGKQIYDAVIRQGKVRQMSTGSNEFMLGTT